MKGKMLAVTLFVLAVILTGCRKPERVVEFKPPYDRPLAPGQQALRKITNPTDIPDFTVAALDLKDLMSSVERSINYLNKPSSKQYFPNCGITHKHARESLEEFLRLLDSGM
ncbi:MAG: hypothetical protein ACYSSI_06525, partial [Planctomycetota bacterium]